METKIRGLDERTEMRLAEQRPVVGDNPDCSPTHQRDQIRDSPERRVF